MTRWALVLCEGAHEEEFLASLLACSGWSVSRVVPAELPQSLIPTPSTSRLKKTGHDYFVCPVIATNARGNRIVLKGCGGDEGILTGAGKVLIKTYAEDASAIGVVIDADLHNVKARVEALRSAFVDVCPDFAKCCVGRLDRSVSSVAVWVAPDCKSCGTLDSLVLESHTGVSEIRVSVATKYVDDLALIDSHEWKLHREKAIAGAIGQRVKAGGSLASAMQERQFWCNSASLEKARIVGVREFLVSLVD